MSNVELGYRIFLTVFAIYAGIAGNEARKRGDVASTVFFCTLWLGTLVASLEA